MGTSSTKKKKTKTAKTVEYEVLNPESVASSSTSPPPETEEEDEAIVPEMTPAIAEFSKLPLGGFQKSWEFIQAHREVVVPGASDALLIAGYRAEREERHEYAKQCIHQSLLLQYAEKLGKDGVSVFFRKYVFLSGASPEKTGITFHGRMIAEDPQPIEVFMKDVNDTYKHIVSRVKSNKEEEEALRQGTEQIQLVPENPDAEVSFNIPEGPPENLKLEGPGTENMDIEEVRKMLQLQWDVFGSFEEDMKAALKSQKLESVNKVLGAMTLDDAERVVESLQISGILNFSESGVRDGTSVSRNDVD